MRSQSIDWLQLELASYILCCFMGKLSIHSLSSSQQIAKLDFCQTVHFTKTRAFHKNMRQLLYQQPALSERKCRDLPMMSTTCTTLAYHCVHKTNIPPRRRKVEPPSTLTSRDRHVVLQQFMTSCTCDKDHVVCVLY